MFRKPVGAAIAGGEGASGDGGGATTASDLFFAGVVEVFTKEGNALADGDAIKGCVGDEVAATAVGEGTGSGEEEGRCRQQRILRIVMSVIL